MTSPEFSSDRKALSGLPPKSLLRIVKRPSAFERCSPLFPPQTKQARRERYHRRRHASRGHRDDGQPRDPGCGSRGPRELSELWGLLLVELDGPVAEVEALMTHVNEICRSNGASEIRLAQSDAERSLVWKGRKAAFAAMGRISPNYIVQDGVIPRTALPRVMSEI